MNCKGRACFVRGWRNESGVELVSTEWSAARKDLDKDRFKWPLVVTKYFARNLWAMVEKKRCVKKKSSKMLIFKRMDLEGDHPGLSTTDLHWPGDVRSWKGLSVSWQLGSTEMLRVLCVVLLCFSLSYAQVIVKKSVVNTEVTPVRDVVVNIAIFNVGKGYLAPTRFRTELHIW